MKKILLLIVWLCFFSTTFASYEDLNQGVLPYNKNMRAYDALASSSYSIDYMLQWLWWIGGVTHTWVLQSPKDFFKKLNYTFTKEEENLFKLIDSYVVWKLFTQKWEVLMNAYEKVIDEMLKDTEKVKRFEQPENIKNYAIIYNIVYSIKANKKILDSVRYYKAYALEVIKNDVPEWTSEKMFDLVQDYMKFKMKIRSSLGYQYCKDIKGVYDCLWISDGKVNNKVKFYY